MHQLTVCQLFKKSVRGVSF